MDSTLFDIRLALRSLRSSPGFAVVTVLTLAVAIGAITAIFSVVDAVLLRPLPYPEPDRIVRVGLESARRDADLPFSDRGYWHFVENNRSFEHFGGFTSTQFPLTSDGVPVQVTVGIMTRSAFDAIGVQPAMGRFPTAEEDAPGAPLVVLIGRGLWNDRYGADPGILGRTMEINGQTAEIIGVMPEGYDFPTPEIDLWAPYRLNPANPNFGGHHIGAVGRLSAGATPESAADDGAQLVSRFGEAGYGPEWLSEVFTGRTTITTLRDSLVGDARRPLFIILGTVLFVLLIACSNVANLLLVRAEGRARDTAVRVALGSGRARLVRTVLTESVILALIGGLLGLALAWIGTRILVAAGPAAIPRLHEIRMSGTVLLFTMAVALGSGVLFGLFPAFRVWSRNSMEILRDGGRGSTVGHDRHRARSFLVVSQVALALVLLVGSGLMVRSFQRLRSVDPGFRTEGVISFGLSLPPNRYQTPEQTARFFTQLIGELEALPGVASAGGINTLPLTTGGALLATQIEEFPIQPGEFPAAFRIRRVTPGYFETMGISLVEGRTFEDRDHDQRLGSAILSASFKERYWPGTSALGKRVAPSTPAMLGTVGVVGDIHDESIEAPIEPMIYLPMMDSVGGGVRQMRIVVQSNVDPSSLVTSIRSVVQTMDPLLPITDVQPISELVADSISRTSFTMALLVLAAIIALFLGAVGIYGVISYVVTQRTAEMGIRQALGAAPAHVRALVLRQGLVLAATGVAVGIVASAYMGRFLASLLYGISAFDLLTFVGGTLVFLAVAAAASMVPALRASRIEPAIALREE